MIDRRNFLKISALASCAPLLPSFISETKPNLGAFKGKKLIIIQLSGGNDGLNTFIPFRNDIYYRSRSQLAIRAEESLGLTDELGLHPSMVGLNELYDNGDLCLLHAVGYPNPSRSHFRSMDIWHTASDANTYLETGWLGRFLDANCLPHHTSHQVLELDDSLSLAVKGTEAKAIALSNPTKLHRQTKDPYFQKLVQASKHSNISNTNLAYMYKTMVESYDSAEYIHEKAKTFKSRTQYPTTRFGQQLKQIAELICAGAETQVFYISLSGFDTHANQKNQQARLLTQYSEGVSAFVKDLKMNDRWQESLIMTFSEFGRRVTQNASRGTDHGKANNLWLIGGKLDNPGIYNEMPNLQALDEGDIHWQIDFRDIYATILENWLETDHRAVLGRGFTLHDFI